jgi:hypothetical protein
MNAFNRIVVILLIVVAMLVTGIVVLAPHDALTQAAGFFESLSTGAQKLDSDNWPLFATGRVAAGAIVAAVGILVVWAEVRRPRRKVIHAQKLVGGESFVTVESINQRLGYTLDQLPDVIRTTPHVAGYGRGGLDLELTVETSPDIDIPMKTGEILQVTKEVIVERMGLKLGKVQVKIKHAPYPKA